MKAMILAAGRGDRMLPLTAELPKPLLPIGETTLIQRHIRRLAEAGIQEIVINTHYLAEKITLHLGEQQFGVPIRYSHENVLLETAGGIQAALPLLGNESFVLVNGDLFTDFDFTQLMVADSRSHLIMVPNPPHHPEGDFGIGAGSLLTHESPCFTYAGIARYSAAFFENVEPGRRTLRSLFNAAVDNEELGGELFTGGWTDVGTPERYRELMAQLHQQVPDL